MIYLIVLVFLFILIIRYDIRGHQLGYRFFWGITLISFILISGLRYKIGSDTLVYLNEYSSFPSFLELFSFDFSSTRYNFLWIFFCSICKTISPSYFFMQFVHALIINCIIFRYLYKNVNYRYTSLFLYFIFGFIYFNTEILRESMAVCAFLLSINSYYKKKWATYYLLAFIAFLFHSSAIFIFIFPFFSNVKLNRSFIQSFIVCAILIGVFGKFLYDLLFYISASEIKDGIRPYLMNNIFTYNKKGVILSVFTYALLPFICIFFAKKYFRKPAKEAPFLWLYIILGVFVAFNNTIFTRLQNYLFFPFIVSLSELFFELKERNEHVFARKTRVFVLLILLVIGRYYNYLKPDVSPKTLIYQRYYPYSSILTKETTEERNLLENHRLKYK